MLGLVSAVKTPSYLFFHTDVMWDHCSVLLVVLWGSGFLELIMTPST